MGLDSGIKMRIKISPAWVEMLGFDEAIFEIAYWRKCWNFRGDVLDFFGGDVDAYDYPMTIEDFAGINEIISKHISEKTSEIIWDSKEMKKIHKANRKVLKDCLLLAKYGGEIAVASYLIDLTAESGYGEEKKKAEALKTLDTVFLGQAINSIEYYFYDSY